MTTKLTSKLTSKIFPALKATIFVVGAVTLQACFFGGGHRYAWVQQHHSEWMEHGHQHEEHEGPHVQR